MKPNLPLQNWSRPHMTAPFDGFRKNREEDFCIQLSENTDFNCDEPSQFTPLMAREVLESIRIDNLVENRMLECNLTVLN